VVLVPLVLLLLLSVASVYKSSQFPVVVLLAGQLQYVVHMMLDVAYAIAVSMSVMYVETKSNLTLLTVPVVQKSESI
jgi:hypothetical protein